MHRFNWLRQLPLSFHRQLGLLAKGISGAERREKQRLLRQLSALRAEYNQLQQTREDMHRQLSLENRGLHLLYEEAKTERDDLQLEIWELEDLVEEIFQLLTSVEAEPTVETVTVETVTVETVPEIPFGARARVEAQPPGNQLASPTKNYRLSLESVDLSGIKLALVGGHDATRQAVIAELTKRHGLTEWVELPPFSKHSLGRSNIKAKIHNCNLIVLITGYMRHSQTHSIMQMRKLNSLSGDILLLNCRGRSGVVREILTYIGQKNS